MALENILSQEIVQKLGWTLLHFVWQAAAVALLLGILLALLRKSSASMRYIIACAALGLIVLLPIVTMLLIPISTPKPIAEIEPALPPVVLHVEPVDQTPLTRALESMEMAQPENVETATPVNWKQQASELLESSLPYLVLGWLLGVFGLSLWHLGGWAQLQRLREKMVKQVDDSLSATMHRLSDRLGVKRAVQLLESALVQVPTVVGWLRPVILLPASAMTGLTTEQLEALLAHELAHIRRYDYLFNMLQTVVETLGFYHPAVWWVSHRIRVERENCCDDLAVSISGNRVRYARALTSMEEIRTGRNELALTVTGGSLFSRIRRLVGNESIDSRISWIPSAITILLIAIIAMSARLAICTPSKSQEPEKKTEIAGDAEKKQSVRVDNFTSTTVGPIGPSALLFDGVDDCLHVPASPTLELKPPFIIEMWIKPDFSEVERIKASGEDFYGLSLLRKGNKLQDEGKQVGGLAMLLHPSRVGSVYFVDDNSSISVQTGLFGRDESALRAHPGWLHISVNCTRQEYIPVPEEPLFIGGAIEPPFLPPFKGQIAEIRIWNKVLSDADSRQYGQTSLKGSEPNLVACWDFEYNEGQTVYDKSPNANHAYIGTSPDADDADPIWVSPDTIQHQVNRKTDAPVEIDKGSIEGRIININTGKGISGVEIAAVPNSLPESNERVTCTTAEDGTFAITSLQSGEYLLQGDFPSVDVDVISGRCTGDVLIGVDRRETVPALKETTAEQQSNRQIVIGLRLIEMPADAMKDAFGPNENPSSGLLVRHGHEITGRLSTIARERKDANLLAAPQMLLNNNSNGTIALIKEEFFIHHYEPVEGEPGKLAPQLQNLEIGWKFKIYAKILEGGVKVHMDLATAYQQPGFETRQYRPDYDYQIPPRPEIFAAELTAKNSEPVAIGRLRRDETAYCLIVTPSVILPEQQPESLLGKKLPEFENIQNIDDLKLTEGKPALICFWDMNQRPSRNLVGELAKQEKELTEKNVAIYLIQTSNVEPEKLKEWLNNRYISFPYGSIKNDTEKVLFTWGVRAQPWLILTDQNGLVSAEGFNLEQLDEKLQEKTSDLPVGDSDKAISTDQESTNQKTVTGVVRDEKGRPSEGVKFILERIRQVFTSDTEGNFKINFDPLRNVEYEYTDFLLARDEKHNLAAFVELDKDKDFETLDIKLKPGVIISGKVVDPENRSIAGASITPFIHLPMYGTTIGGLPRQTTDSEGNFELKVLPTGPEYSVEISDYGYRKESSMNIQTVNLSAERRVDIGRIKLPVASLSVSGIVVDANDKPVPNAKVCIMGEHQPPDHETQTDFDGKFTFEKVCDVIVQVCAYTSGTIYLHGSAVTYGGATDVKIIVTEEGTDRFLSKPSLTLVGSKLPGLQELQIAVRPDDLKNRKILLCFWDMERRSRNSISKLAKREKELAEKNVIVLLVHTSGVEPSKVKKWLVERKIPFICGSIKDNVVDVLSRWGMQTEPWLILTDQNGIVRAEGFGVEQLDEKLQAEESAANNSSVPVLSKSTAPLAEDKSIVKVDLAWVEVPAGSQVDRETITEIRNRLAGKITVPDSPAVADLLRNVAEATANVKDETGADKRVSKEQFKTLADLLASRGFVKILMNPTLEVTEHQTAQIKDEQNLLEVTANAVKDDIIYLTVKADLSSQIAPANEGKEPIISTRSFANFVSISSGQSQIIGGMVQMPVQPDANTKKRSQTSAGELMCIVTASIIAPVEPKEPMETVNFKNVQAGTIIEKLAEWSGKTIIPTDELMKQRITVFSPQQISRSEAAAMILNALCSKGYTAEQSDETIYLKPLSAEQSVIDKDKIQIDTKILTASDEFMRYIGLDPNSVASSEGWSDYLVHSTDDSASFIVDQLHEKLLLRNVAARMRTHKDIRMLHLPRALVASGKQFEITVPKFDYYMLTASDEPNGVSDEPESKSHRIELGTTIRLTPTLTPDGKNIELDFEWEYRRLRGIKEHTGPDGKVLKVPRIDVDSIKTPCTVPDGKTLLIAGKKITVQKKKEPRKPGLADLPLIGRFYNNPPQAEETKNLLIMVTPSTKIKAPIIPPPTDPNDPLIKKLEEKFNRYDEKKTVDFD